MDLSLIDRLHVARYRRPGIYQRRRIMQSCNYLHVYRCIFFLLEKEKKTDRANMNVHVYLSLSILSCPIIL